MKFYESVKAKEDIQKIVDTTYTRILKNFPAFKSITKNEVSEIINYYIPIADRLRQAYIDGSEEKTKLLSDIFIKSIYMAIKNIKTQADLNKSKKSVWLRDKIWVTLSEMKKTMNLIDGWKKYLNPSEFREQVEIMKTEPLIINELTRKDPEIIKAIQKKDPEIKKIIEENKKADISIQDKKTAMSPLIWAAVGIGAILVFMSKKK